MVKIEKHTTLEDLMNGKILIWLSFYAKRWIKN